MPPSGLMHGGVSLPIDGLGKRFSGILFIRALGIERGTSPPAEETGIPRRHLIALKALIAHIDLEESDGWTKRSTGHTGYGI